MPGNERMRERETSSLSRRVARPDAAGHVDEGAVYDAACQRAGGGIERHRERHAIYDPLLQDGVRAPINSPDRLIANGPDSRRCTTVLVGEIHGSMTTSFASLGIAQQHLIVIIPSLGMIPSVASTFFYSTLNLERSQVQKLDL